ncbi:SH3 domain-containing protein [Chloroflexota bacterium]
MRNLAMLFGLILALGLASGQVVAQDSAVCDVVWMQSVSAAAAACADLPSGVVCKGAEPVVLTAQDETTLPYAALTTQDDLARIITAEHASDVETVGISLLRVPGVGEGEQLFAVLFGTAQLENDSGPPRGPLCNATSLGSVNVRTEPNTESTILGQLAVNQSAPITARLADASWWRILWGNDPAWIFADLAPADCDPAQMLVFDPVTEELSGGLAAPAFQNARLSSSFVDAVCPEVPRGGLLLQSEPGGASWRINNMVLGLDGTVLLQASPHDGFVAYVFEGQVSLEVAGLSRTAEASQLLRVPLQNGVVVAMPGPALDMTPHDALTAPLSLLPRAVLAPTGGVKPGAVYDTGLVCDAVPQQVVMADGERSLEVVAEAEQTLRVSVEAANIESVSVIMPDGALLPLAGESYSVDGGQAFVTDFLTAGAGVYTFVAEESGGSQVQWGVTCDLPQAAPLPAVQACADVLLRWTAVTGNTVRFTAPFGATVSVQAGHVLPSQGAAQTLTVQMASGEPVGQMPFTGFVAQQAAGPFDFIAPRDAEYHIGWDGDPFNQVAVEVLCLLPAGDAAETDQ